MPHPKFREITQRLVEASIAPEGLSVDELTKLLAEAADAIDELRAWVRDLTPATAGPDRGLVGIDDPPSDGLADGGGGDSSRR